VGKYETHHPNEGITNTGGKKERKLATMGPRQKDPVLDSVSPTAGSKVIPEEEPEEVRWSSEASTVAVSHVRQNGMFCCGGASAGKTKKVQTGADLGVWEKSLEDRSGLVGRWLLSYLNPLLDVGSNKVLDANDIGVPPQQDRADRAYATALSAWNEQSDKCRIINEKRKSLYEKKLAACRTDQQRAKVKPPQYKEPSIAGALVKAFGLTELFVGLFYYVLSALLTFVPVMILSDLVTYFESGKRGYAHPWVEVVGLAVIPFTALSQGFEGVVGGSGRDEYRPSGQYDVQRHGPIATLFAVCGHDGYRSLADCDRPIAHLSTGTYCCCT
jgi:hypothetical protein